MEIERKWLVKKIPKLSNLKYFRQERYFIFIKKDIELRVQKNGRKYELERKSKVNNLTWDSIRLIITKDEFDFFKSKSFKSIVRDVYHIESVYNTSLKIYHCDFEGLVRVEVEFLNVDEAKNYIPLKWFGKEITNSDLGHDKKLINLTEKAFLKLLYS